MLPDDASARLGSVRDSIARAARIAGRPADDVTLIAISKTHEPEAIRPLIAAGQRICGVLGKANGARVARARLSR